MKSKKFYSNLDVCVNFNNIAKKKQKSVADTAIPVRNKSSFCITPLAAAVCLIISGMAFSSQVWADTTFSSPKTVSGEETLSSGLNSSSSSGATVTITSTGILNFPDSDTCLSGSEDSNSITSYGTINGASSLLSTIYGGVGVTYGSVQIVDGTPTVVYSDPHANNNTVTFKSGSTISDVNVYGGRAVNTTESVNATASNNKVLIENGSVFSGSSVYGGYAEATGTATASENTVILGAGSYEMVYGGVANSTTSQTATAVNNRIYLYGDADVSAAGLVGGYIGGSGTLSGNTLVFGYNNQAWAPSNYTIGNVQNFSTIRFDNATWGKTITVYYFANQSTDSTVTKVDATNVAFSGVDSLSSGDSYDMLTIEELASGSLELTSENSTYTIGTTLEGTGKVSLSDDGKTVTYTVDSASEQASSQSTVDSASEQASSQSTVDSASEQASSQSTVDSASEQASSQSLSIGSKEQKVDSASVHASSQSHAAAMTMSAGTVALTQGADTTSAAGFNLANSGITGVQSFSSVGGGASRVETGSFVSLKTLNFSVGIGNNVQNDYGLLSIGGAFEAGYGKFKNHFDAGAADPYIKKTGHVSYYGLALLSNFTFENLWHVNGAVRVGRMKSTQNNALYNAATGETYDINIGTNYYGLELGGGKLIKIDDTNSLDIYGKYFYLYQASDSFNAGGKYKLSAVNSHRLRVAGRYSHDFTPVTSLYGGLGLEHEFDGKSKLKVDDKAWAKSSKTKGTRAFGEIGVAVKPASNTGLILDFSVKGLYGDNFRGAWASADIKYMF